MNQLLTRVLHLLFKLFRYRKPLTHEERLARLDPDIRDIDLYAAAYLLARKHGYSTKRTTEAMVSMKEILQLYRRYPQAPIVPTVLADAIWHEWLSLPYLYAEQTTKLFGHLLCHDPFAGMRSELDYEAQKRRLRKTRKLLSELQCGNTVVSSTLKE